ncbi:hypothetical protein DPMN_184958 [Dreissena polymorpha]|uniref:Uncharacterized protein n=1 Tax=Dreissena polymorpha TaxID=45954 RepID=A0A9D4DKZ9_DREPO|nr:hypothetical protein DPMN_184958 [Dreissena polymorpha]
MSNIIGTNLMTKFHKNRKINVASRVLTRFYYSHIMKKCPAPWHPFFSNELIQDIIETNLPTKFHKDWTINVVSRVLTRNNAPPLIPRWPYIIGTNLLTKFHDDRKINETSRVLTRKIAPPLWWLCFSTNRHYFKLHQDIIGMNLLTEFHEDRTINVASRVKNAPPLGGHVIQGNTKLLTIFHQDWTINVASRVLTIFYYSHIRKNAPAPGGHVFQPTGIIFELVQDIIRMNLLTKFHEDQTINVASRVKNAPPLGSHAF